MSKIYIEENNICRLDEEDDVSFLRALDTELSFAVQGAHHTRAFKGYVDSSGEGVRWDGIQRLLTGNLTFPYGLLARVKNFHIDNNRTFEIIDQRKEKSIGKEIDIITKLKSINKEPYYYQYDALQSALNNDCGILKLSTGAGKTIIAAMIAAKLGKKTIIYVIGTGLLYQIHNLFTSLFNQEIGIIGDGKCIISDINIATIWTVGNAIGLKVKKVEDEEDEQKIEPTKHKEIKNMLEETKVHIIDECHLSACSTIQEIYRYINPEHIYGFSGTPFRDDGADLLIEAVLGKYIIDISATKLINEGFLVPPTIKFLTVDKMNGLSDQKYKSIYRNYIVENEVRNNLISLAAQKLVEQNFQTLVLFNSIDHGKILYDLISKHTSCILLSGKDSSKIREDAKKQLEAGVIKCVIASKIFDIGVDIPSLSGLIIAAGGKSSVRALQRIGRVIRKADHKKMVAVIDFIDQAKYLSDHSKIRRKIYEMEEGFKVLWLKK